MIKYGVFAAIFVLLATAVVATFRSDNEATASNSSAIYSGGSASQDFEQRLANLEKTIAEERQQRIRLQEQLASLSQSQATSSVQQAGEGRFAALAEEGVLPENIQTLRDQIEERRNGGGLDAEERQIASLVEAGFDQYQAEQILRTTEEMQMNLLNARFEASQTGEEFNAGQMQAQAIAELRASLGEADYERYLEATNQSTSVGVSNVLASSPAELAGMQSGDQIVSYNGERVFNTNDLNRMTNSSEVSGNVIVEVIRNGESVSLSVPSGPIGITSGRGGFNRGR